MKPQITIVGSAAVWDYIYLVNTLPQTGDIVEIINDSTGPIPGGCAPNIAVSIARLCSNQPQLMYPVGSDFPSSGLKEVWVQEGIDCTYLELIETVKSGYSNMFMDQNGSTMCFAYPGAADIALPKNLNNLGDWVVIAPVLNQYTVAVLNESIKSNKRIVVTGISSKGIILYLEQIHYLIVNLHESKILLKHLNLSSIDEFVTRYPNLTIYITNGNDGSDVYTDGLSYHIPVISNLSIKDYTGAGDAYTSGVICGLLRGNDSYVSGYLGTVNASFALEKVGGQSNLPTWSRLLDRLGDEAPNIKNKVK